MLRCSTSRSRRNRPLPQRYCEPQQTRLPAVLNIRGPSTAQVLPGSHNRRVVVLCSAEHGERAATGTPPIRPRPATRKASADVSSRLQEIRRDLIHFKGTIQPAQENETEAHPEFTAAEAGGFPVKTSGGRARNRRAILVHFTLVCRSRISRVLP